MNSCTFTGWLPREADVRAAKSSGAPVLFLQAVVRTSGGEEEVLHFRCDDAALIERHRALLTKGRTIITRAGVDRFWHPMSGFSGAMLGFRIFDLEVPDRSRPAAPATPEAATPTEGAKVA